MDKIKELLSKCKDIILRYKDDILKPIIVLLAICVVIPLALAVTNAVTVDKIAALEVQKSKEAMQSLISADSFEEQKADDGSLYHIALKDGETVGYIFSTAAKGYGGDVSVMTAIKPDGTVKSVAILDVSNETPGLGQNAAKEDFYSQFEDKAEDIKLLKNGAEAKNNEIDAVTGATITSKAVTNAVNEALERFNKVSGSEVAVNEKQ